jgi:hypothetical protein
MGHASGEIRIVLAPSRRRIEGVEVNVYGNWTPPQQHRSRTQASAQARPHSIPSRQESWSGPPSTST